MATNPFDNPGGKGSGKGSGGGGGGGGNPFANPGGATGRGQAVAQAKAKLNKRGGGLGGLVGEVGDIVSSVPSGLFNLAKSAGTEIVESPYHLVHGIATGNAEEAIGGTPLVGQLYGLNKGFITGETDTSLPLSSGFGASFRSTAEDVRDPGRFVTAYEKGHLVGKVLEDVGNVAIVGGTAAKTLDVATGGRVAEAATARNVATAAEKAVPALEREAGALESTAAAHETALEKMRQIVDAAKGGKNRARLGADFDRARGVATDSRAAADTARKAVIDQSTHAAEATARADELMGQAGSLYKPYRVAKSIANLGNQGAMAPIKPYETIAKGLSKATRDFVEKNPMLKDALTRFDERMGLSEAVRRVEARAGTDAWRAKRGMAHIDRIVNGDDALYQASISDATGMGAAVERQAQLLGEAGPAGRLGAEARLAEVASAMGYEPRAFALAVRKAAGTLDAETAAKMDAINGIWHDSGIAKWLESNITSDTQGLRRAPTPEQQAMGEWNVSGQDLPPGARERVGRRTLKRGESKQASAEANAAKLGRLSESLGIEPGIPERQARAEIAGRIGEEATGYGSIGKLRAVEAAARSEGAATAARSAAARFDAIRARLPGAVSDATVQRLADAVGRWTAARDGLAGAVDAHAPAPEVMARVRDVRQATIDAVEREVSATPELSHIPFVPGDISEYHQALHEAAGSRVETSITREVEKMRDNLGKRAAATTSTSDLWVRAYKRLFRRLPSALKQSLREMTDAEVRTMYERYRDGTVTPFEGKLDEHVGEWLDSPESVGSTGDPRVDVQRFIAEYANKARLEEFLRRAKRQDWGANAYDLLHGSAALGGLDDQLARLAIEGTGTSAKLHDIAAELAQREAATAAVTMPDPARLADVLDNEPFPIDDHRAIELVQDAFGDQAASDAFLSKWVDGGEPPLGAELFKMQNGETPQFLQDQPTAGLETLNRQEAARSEIAGTLATEGGQALDPDLRREAGMLIGRAKAAEARAGKGVEAGQALIGSLTERGAKTALSESRTLERYVKTLRALGADVADIKNLPEWEAAEIDKLYKELTNAPARARGAIKVGREFTQSLLRWRKELVAGVEEGRAPFDPILMDRLDEAISAGIRDVRDIWSKVEGPRGGTHAQFEPQYRPGGQPLRAVEGAPTSRRPGARRLRSQLAREEIPKTAQLFPRSTAEMRVVLGDRIETQTKNATVRLLAQQYGRRADAVLGDTTDMAPRDIAAAMAEKGYVAWNPESLFGRVEPKAITPGTLFISEAVSKAVDNYFGEVSHWEQGLRTYYDKPIGYWKHAVLALRPAWHVNNIVGNAFMAMVGGGLSPLEYAKRIRQAHAVLKLPEARLDVAYPESVARSGLGAERRLAKATSPERLAKLERRVETIEPTTREALGGAGREAVPPEISQGGPGAGLAQSDEVNALLDDPGRLRRTIDKSYALNGAFDDMNRLAVYLSKRAKLTEADLSNFRASHPELGGLSAEQIRSEGALRISLTVAGDFMRMTPLERQVFRRIVPFYAWIRHITKLTATLAKTNPMRVIWLLHIAELLGDPAHFGLANTLPIGGGLIQGPNLNPFGDVTSLNPKEALFNTSPAIKVGAGLFGIDLNRRSGFQRPPGQPGGYGGDPNQPVVAENPLELAHLLGNQLPQVRALSGIADTVSQGKPVLRYPLGQVRRTAKTQGGEPVGSGEPVLGPLARYLGIPYVRQPNVYEARDLRSRKKERKVRAKLRAP